MVFLLIEVLSIFVTRFVYIEAKPTLSDEPPALSELTFSGKTKCRHEKVTRTGTCFSPD